MSSILTTAPAAGWYDDPAGAAAWRWWDGTIWTGHLRPKHEEEAAEPAQPLQPIMPAVLTPATPASEQLYWHSAEAEIVEIPGRVATTNTEAASRSAGDGHSWGSAHFWGEVGSPQTAGIWLLAALPLLSIALQFAVGLFFGAVFLTTGLAPDIPDFVFYGILLTAAWVFAALDITSLRARGYQPPAIWWMLLLPPLAYFIVRGRVVRREGQRAWPPELLYVLSVVGIIGITVASVVAAMSIMGGPGGIPG